MRFDLSGCGAGLDESSKSLLKLGSLAEALGYDGLWINGNIRSGKPDLSFPDPAGDRAGKQHCPRLAAGAFGLSRRERAWTGLSDNRSGSQAAVPRINCHRLVTVL
jgi:hypothetical protein